MEEGISFMAVQHKLSTSKPFVFPMIFGKLSNFKLPKRSRELSNIKLTTNGVRKAHKIHIISWGQSKKVSQTFT